MAYMRSSSDAVKAKARPEPPKERVDGPDEEEEQEHGPDAERTEGPVELAQCVVEIWDEEGERDHEQRADEDGAQPREVQRRRGHRALSGSACRRDGGQGDTPSARDPGTRLHSARRATAGVTPYRTLVRYSFFAPPPLRGQGVARSTRNPAPSGARGHLLSVTPISYTGLYQPIRACHNGRGGGKPPRRASLSGGRRMSCRIGQAGSLDHSMSAPS